MKLSEAIRLGAMVSPQGFGDLWDGDARCAMGGAFEAAGCKVQPKGQLAPGTVFGTPLRDGLAPANFSVEVPAGWFVLLNSLHMCPGCLVISAVSTVITHLNDQHRWTRERIADWVATLEPRESTVKAEVEAPPSDESFADAALSRS